MRPGEVTRLLVAAGVIPATGEDIESARELVAAGVPAVAIGSGQPDPRRLGEGIRASRAADGAAVIGLTAAALPEGLDAHVDFLLADRFDEPLARACHRAGTAYVPRVRHPRDVAAAIELNVGLVTTTGTAPVPLPGLAAADGPQWLGCFPGSDAALAAAVTAGIECFELDLSAEGARDGGWLDEGGRVGIAQRARARVRQARGEPLYGAIEHVGIYATPEAEVGAITAWYGEVFGLPTVTRRTSFVGRGVYGRIEVLAEPVGERCHLAVRVRDFDEAVTDLTGRGYPLEAFAVSPASKLAYLRDRDPGGNLVHIMWRP